MRRVFKLGALCFLEVSARSFSGICYEQGLNFLFLWFWCFFFFCVWFSDFVFFLYVFGSHCLCVVLWCCLFYLANLGFLVDVCDGLFFSALVLLCFFFACFFVVVLVVCDFYVGLCF